MKAAVLMSLTAPSTVTADGSNGPTLREIVERQQWFQHGRGTENGKMSWSRPSRSDRSTKKPAWTLAEAAMACRNLSAKCYLAVRYEFAMDQSVFHDLRRALVAYAQRARTINRWPATVKTAAGHIDPLDDLAIMHLVEVRQPWRFKIDKNSKTQSMWAIVMGVDDSTWRRQLQPQYETIGDEYRRWRDIGERHMQRLMREDA